VTFHSFCTVVMEGIAAGLTWGWQD